ncbi:MAG: peptidoglycan DD-metalloendopeptidase family protein [Microcoleaceae cyanobacterium]
MHQYQKLLITTICFCLVPITETSAQITAPNIQFPLDSPNTQTECLPPVLSRLQRHRVVAGETIESIARQYNLLPATLMGFNRGWQTGQVTIGENVVIPPVNGIAVKIPAGQTWQNIADTYNIRADALFEANGCPGSINQQINQQTPDVVFVPGVNWSPAGQVRAPLTQLSQLLGQPLAIAPNEIKIGLNYGWVFNEKQNQVIFHSGLDLLAPLNTNVLAVGTGAIAFAGEQGNYGNLVVINHADGKQSRYAHLDSIKVRVGQKVQSGDILGSVGNTGKPDLDQPHLHWEIRYNSAVGWVAENPQPYFIQLTNTVIPDNSPNY